MDTWMLDKRLEKLCKKNKVVGVNAALFDSKGIIYSYNYGFANKEKGIKSDNDSLYMIGSNTKVMTALGILKLLEEGKLSLDDDIKKFIPEFEVKSYFKYDKITIEKGQHCMDALALDNPLKYSQLVLSGEMKI